MTKYQKKMKIEIRYPEDLSPQLGTVIENLFKHRKDCTYNVFWYDDKHIIFDITHIP